jgi:acetoacetyl-CoA synthetase
MSNILWEPSEERRRATHLHRFMKAAPGSPHAYEDLWQWSVTERGAFWQAVWEYCGIIASTPPEAPVGAEAMPGTIWFPGARLNFAENLLRDPDDSPAVIAAAEGASPITVTRAGLRARVARFQAGLRRLGVGPGDRVAALVTNGVEALVSMLATTATGAIWSSTSPDFGPLGVIDRFGQIEPKALIAVDGYRYNGTVHRVGDTVRAAVDAIPTIEHVLTIDVVGAGHAVASAIAWDDIAHTEATDPHFEQLPFDHPAFILYSSGTTGRPKSIIHGAGGTLIKHLCEHQLHSDVQPGDRMFWFTTCGWMMWNWLVGGLASRAAVVLYDGSPSHPDLGALWRLASDAGITHFGTSPKFLAANSAAGIMPADIADLSAMRWLGSTGAPLNPDQFDWVYDAVKSDVQLASISGGTDIVGCFALGVPTLPVRRGEIQARALGMAVESWDDDGVGRIGRKGELVCTAPFPSMPVGFWNDHDGEKYRAAYFAEHPSVWTHGDFIEIRPEGGVIIYGRSDTTLNPGGVRIGTAEIYRAVETLPEIADSIAVGHDTGGDVEVILFVVPAPGMTLDDALVGRIGARIREQTSPRHVPRRVLAIDEVPYTLSGKKVEKAVRLILAGEPVTNRDALANPGALDQFEGILEG